MYIVYDITKNRRKFINEVEKPYLVGFSLLTSPGYMESVGFDIYSNGNILNKTLIIISLTHQHTNPEIISIIRDYKLKQISND
jgi:hypothetical protein